MNLSDVIYRCINPDFPCFHCKSLILLPWYEPNTLLLVSAWEVSSLKHIKTSIIDTCSYSLFLQNHWNNIKTENMESHTTGHMLEMTTIWKLKKQKQKTAWLRIEKCKWVRSPPVNPPSGLPIGSSLSLSLSVWSCSVTLCRTQHISTRLSRPDIKQTQSL